MFKVLFAALPGLMAAGAVTAAVAAFLRLRRIKAAWNSGLTAEGRCVRTYVVTTVWRRGHQRSSSSELRHVYEFTGPDGEQRRFEEDGSATVFEGDPVVVRYPHGRPDRATALPPGDRRVKARAAVQIGFCAFFTLVSLAVAGIFFTVAQGVSDIDKERKRIPTAPDNRPEEGPTGLPALPQLPPMPTDLPAGPTDMPPLPSGFPTLAPPR